MWFVDLNPLSTFLKSAGGSLPPRTDCTWPASSQCTGLASLRAGQVRFLSRAPPRRGEGGAALGLLWPGSCLPSPREAPHSPSCFLDLLLRDPGYSHSKLSFPRVLLPILYLTLLSSGVTVRFSFPWTWTSVIGSAGTTWVEKQNKTKIRWDPPMKEQGAACPRAVGYMAGPRGRRCV